MMCANTTSSNVAMKAARVITITHIQVFPVMRGEFEVPGETEVIKLELVKPFVGIIAGSLAKFGRVESSLSGGFSK